MPACTSSSSVAESAAWKNIIRNRASCNLHAPHGFSNDPLAVATEPVISCTQTVDILYVCIYARILLSLSMPIEIDCYCYDLRVRQLLQIQILITYVRVLESCTTTIIDQLDGTAQRELWLLILNQIVTQNRADRQAENRIHTDNGMSKTPLSRPK